MVAAAAKLPVGSLAFISSEELLFLRIQRGLREIQVKIRSFVSLELARLFVKILTTDNLLTAES